MLAPDLPADERERLRDLESYQLLDTGPEAGLDALTKLAAHLLEVPITLVSLVDGRRQWFKSRVGLDATETPREISFCGHVVAQNAPMVVDDATGDPRFFDNPLVTGPPHIRFYAGMPLRSQAGHVLGTLCAIDRKPHDLPPEKLELLRLLAGQVADQLEARRQRRLLAGKNAALARSEALLRQSEARLLALFGAMAEGVAEQDSTGAIVDCNPAAERILGLTRDQLMGRTSIDPRWRATHADGTDFPGEQHPAMVTLRTGQPTVAVPMRIRKPDGSLTAISVSASPVALGPDGKPTSIVVSFRDSTQELLLGERVARQERLATTGTLAAGVGHEINNPLTFITANLEWALEEVQRAAGGSPSPLLRNVSAALGDAREGAERIRKVVRGLRTLAREDGPLVPLDLAGAIEGSVTMSMHEVRSRARVELSLQPVPEVLADEAGLSQIFVNLIVNAAQAFTTLDPTRNVITVRSAVEPDGRVSVEVQDNGPGIEPAVLPRIFDPFFTTKGMGQATGLGLSICNGLALAMKGEVLCQTKVGEGTTFKVLLQPAPAEPASARPAPPQPSGPQARVPPRFHTDPVMRGSSPDLPVPLPASAARGRVLAIDDEVGVLDVLVRMLRTEHDVVACADPREALRKLVDEGQRFDVIFCDLMMPHLGGLDLFRQVRERRPSLADRFVFISGGITQRDVRGFLAKLPNERLDKPFNSKRLREVARRLAARGQAEDRALAK